MGKYLRYLVYVVQHKRYVFIAGNALGVSLWRLIKHDWSKFLPDEFIPYARYFYGTPLEKQGAEDAFDVAWLKHQHRNDHHWQHYVLHEDSGKVKVLEMPEKAVRELCADWFGAGRAINGKWDASDYFYKNAHVIFLHPKTVRRVKQLLQMGDRRINKP